MSRGLINQLTTDDQHAVASGYLLKELAERSMLPGEVEEIRDTLMAKLDKPSPDVRFKALLVLKHLCQYGNDELRMSLQRHNEAVRACSTFRGPPDPLRGDAPYVRVHEAAKEAMTAIYGPSLRPATTHRAMPGFGSTPPEPVAGAPGDRDRPGGYTGTYNIPDQPGAGGKRMVGFGNTNYVPAAATSRPAAPTGAAPAWRQQDRPETYDPSSLPSSGSSQRTRGRVGGDWGSASSSAAAPTIANPAGPRAPAGLGMISPPHNSSRCVCSARRQASTRRVW